MGSIPMQAAIFAGRAAVLVLRTDFQSVDTSSILVRPAKVFGCVAVSSILAGVTKVLKGSCALIVDFSE